MAHSVTDNPSNYWLWRMIGRLAFNRISVSGEENLPDEGPVLYVATHRNGALDAAPYLMAARSAVPMISAQLQRTPPGRFLFQGIAVARDKDRARGIKADNGKALRDCVRLLQQGRRLLVMPEGTSSLGPKHLPYHRGAARIVRAVMDAGVTPVIVPLGVFYEAPTAWQSRVEVWVGEALNPRPESTVDDLHRDITQALESVSADFTDEVAQRTAELLAYASTLGTHVSYARALKSFQHGIPQALADTLQELQRLAVQEHLSLHQGVPLVVVEPWLLDAAYWLLLAPIVLLFALLNLPVLAAAYWAGRTLPDAPNVIAFWRMIIGLPAGVLWSVLLSAALAFSFGVGGVLVYWSTSLGGLVAWYRFRKLSVALHNTLFHANVRPKLLSAYRKLLNGIPYDRIV